MECIHLVLSEQFPDVLAFRLLNISSQGIPDSSVSLKKMNQLIFSCYLFQDGGGIVRENIICFLILRLPDTPKTSVFFWKLFLQHLKTESIACQENRREAGRTISFEKSFSMIRWICILICLRISRFSVLVAGLRKTEDCRSECALSESDETLLFGSTATVLVAVL